MNPRRRSITRLTLLVLALALLPACHFKVGLGDPAKAKADKSLVGHWVSQEGGSVHVITAALRKDGKTYDVEYFYSNGTLEAPTKSGTIYFKGQAWLTTLDETRFVTMKVTKLNVSNNGDAPAKPFTIAKVEASKDKFTLTVLKDSFDAFQRAATPAEMETAVREHLKNAEAYQGTQTFQRSSAKATAKVRANFK